MSFIVKAQHASDSSTPKISHTVSDIAVKTRETRSDNPETFYHLSPTKKTDEETFSLSDSSVDSGELGAQTRRTLNLTLINLTLNDTLYNMIMMMMILL